MHSAGVDSQAYEMLYIAEAEIEQLLNPFELPEVMERALVAFSAGRVTQPVRTIVPIDRYKAFFAVMPAVYEDVIGSKFVTVYPENAQRHLHTHNAVIHLFKAETGEPLALVGGRTITAWRTAAVSALAMGALSDSNAGKLAILGSGVQALSHFNALSNVRKFEEVRVWSRTPEHAHKFAVQTGAVSVSAEEAVNGADVVVTVTNSPVPILRAEWLKSGALIIAVGAVGPHASEIDAETMKQATVIVESRESASHEAGEIIQSGASIYAELGEVLSGVKRSPANGITVYKSLGIAVEDVAAAKLAYDRKCNATLARSQ